MSDRYDEAAASYLHFMETAPEMALRGKAPEDPSQPRHLSDKENIASRAYIQAGILNSGGKMEGATMLRLEHEIAGVPAFSVVRSVYRARLRRIDPSPFNEDHVREKIGFDAFLFAQLNSDDENLKEVILPDLDPEIFVPHLDEAIAMSNQHITRKEDRIGTLETMKFAPARALAFGIRSEIYNSIRYRGNMPQHEQPHRWQPELEDRLLEHMEGSDTAAFMTNACLKAIQASRA
jgi:hypothetical protein